MLERSTTRRLLAIAVLLVASGALVATSPAQPPTNNLDDRETVRATLTADEPVSSVRVTFAGSDEALWSDDPEVTISSARLHFSATGGWASFADDPPRPPDAPDRPIVRLTAVSLESGRPLADEGSRLGDEGVDLLESCPEDLDCLVEYELLVEWIDPIEGLEVGAEIEASSWIQIQGPVDLPAGAEARLAIADPVVLDVPVLSATVGDGVVVDAARPLAMWSIVLDANEGAIPAALAWPIEARGAFTAIISPGPGETGEQLEDDDVSILLIPEDGEEMLPEIYPRQSAQHDFDPLRGCLANARCERRLTVVVRWSGAAADHAATVDWRLDVGIVYHGDAQPTADADMQARIDSETLIGDGGPIITASAEGVVELDASDRGITERRSLELHIPREALEAQLLGGPLPAVAGAFTVEAKSSRPIDGDPIIVLTSFGELPDDASARVRTPHSELNSGPIEFPIHPATHCRANRACDSTLTLGVGLSANDLPRVSDASITVTWSVSIRLQYPAGSEPPASGQIRLVHVEP